MSFPALARIGSAFARLGGRGVRLGGRNSHGHMGPADDLFEDLLDAEKQGREIAVGVVQALSLVRLRVTVTGIPQTQAMLRSVVPNAYKVLNDAARQIQRDMPGYLTQRLDRPTRFTASTNAMFVRYATPGHLEASVLFKDKQSNYLKWVAEGGIKSPGPKGLKLPSAIKLNQHGNIPKGVIAQLIAVARKEGKLGKRRARRIQVSNKVEIFYGDPADHGTKNWPPGIYKIVNDGARRSLIPLVVFPRVNARYTKRLDFDAFGRQVLSRTLQSSVNRHIGKR